MDKKINCKFCAKKDFYDDEEMEILMKLANTVIFVSENGVCEKCALEKKEEEEKNDT